MQLYRRLQFGNLIDLSVLDTRQWRSNQACDGGVDTDCAEALDAGADDARRRAGDSGCSTTWRRAKARWTVIGQQVPTFARDMAKASSGRPVLDGQVGRLRRRARSGCTRG